MLKHPAPGFYKFPGVTAFFRRTLACQTLKTLLNYEKKSTDLIPSVENGNKKLLLTMKLALIIIYLSVLQVSANVYSQINVSLDVKDKSIREVLKSIEQQTQVRFFTATTCWL